jgi:hypothetical protein
MSSFAKDSRSRRLPALVEVRWPDGSVAYLTCDQYCALSTDVLRGTLVRLASEDERGERKDG